MTWEEVIKRGRRSEFTPDGLGEVEGEVVVRPMFASWYPGVVGIFFFPYSIAIVKKSDAAVAVEYRTSILTLASAVFLILAFAATGDTKGNEQIIRLSFCTGFILIGLFIEMIRASGDADRFLNDR